MIVTSTDNPRVKALAKLKKARERRTTGLFLIEGHREVERALSAGVDVETLVVSEELGGTAEISDDNLDVLNVSVAPMRRIAMRENPPGVIAVARQFSTALHDLEVPDGSLLLIAEGVEKPGNVGAMLRTCDAAGAAAMVLADAGTDIFNPNVVRASQGALFSVPVAVAAPSDVISFCVDRNLAIVGGYPDADRELWDVAMTGPTAVLVGAEDSGISSAWNEVVTRVRIPMAGSADSLNASVSASLMLYEAVRQRRPVG